MALAARVRFCWLNGLARARGALPGARREKPDGRAARLPMAIVNSHAVSRLPSFSSTRILGGTASKYIPAQCGIRRRDATTGFLHDSTGGSLRDTRAVYSPLHHHGVDAIVLSSWRDMMHVLDTQCFLFLLSCEYGSRAANPEWTRKAIAASAGSRQLPCMQATAALPKQVINAADPASADCRPQDHHRLAHLAHLQFGQPEV